MHLLRTLICLCFNSKLLKPDDAHLQANISHLNYTQAKFSDLIETHGLKADFEFASQYCLGLKNAIYPGPTIDLQRFSTEKDFTVTAANELLEKIAEHEAEMNTVTEWKNTDADLIAQYNKNFSDFKTQLGQFIKWHVAVIGER